MRLYWFWLVRERQFQIVWFLFGFHILLTVALFLILGVLAGSSLASQSRAQALEEEITYIVNGIMNETGRSPALAASSNPYDYVKKNPEFDSLVRMGPAALPIPAKLIDNSEENGLREYILAIPGDRIACSDSKDGTKAWATAKEWSSRWKSHSAD